jgi:hypothetical protein
MDPEPFSIAMKTNTDRAPWRKPPTLPRRVRQVSFLVPKGRKQESYPRGSPRHDRGARKDLLTASVDLFSQVDT